MANIKPQKELVRQRCDWPTEGEALVWDCWAKHKPRKAKSKTKKAPKP